MAKYRSLLTLLLLAASVFVSSGETVTPARSGAGAFVAPVMESFSQYRYGLSLSGGQSVSLKNLLSELRANGPQTDPRNFERLSGRVAAKIPSPEAFAALPAERAIALLGVAAVEAEAAANAAADEALKRVPEEINAEAVAELASTLDALAFDALYLSPERRERLDMATRKIAAFKKARDDAFQAWLSETPSKIKQGGFDGSAHIVKAQDGWRIGEHAPAQASYPSYAAAFVARLEEISAMPSGPWRLRAFEELLGNLASADVTAQAEAEGTDRVSLIQKAGELQDSFNDYGTGNEKVDEALAAYANYRIQRFRASAAPSPKNTLALLEQYDRLALNRELPLQTQWRILSVLSRGDPDKSGYVWYRYLFEDKKEESKFLMRKAVNGLFASAALGFAAGVAWWAQLPWPVTLGALLLSLMGLVYMGVFLRRESAFAWSDSDSEAYRVLKDFNG